MRAQRAARDPIVRAVVVVTLLLHGCGYTLVGRGKSTLPDHITSIAIPLFTNQTLEPELEKDITSAIRQQFIRDGRLKVVDKARATAVMEGRLENYVLDPLAFDRSDRVTQYRVVIGVHVTVRDLVKNKVLLDQDFSAREEFEVTAAAIGSREAAKVTSRQVASRELAGQLLNLILEGF